MAPRFQAMVLASDNSVASVRFGGTPERSLAREVILSGSITAARFLDIGCPMVCCSNAHRVQVTRVVIEPHGIDWCLS